MGDNASTKPDCRELVAHKQKRMQEAIPPEWRLSKELLEALPVTSVQGVRLLEADVPRRSGILSDVELNITENYSASQLLQKLAGREFSTLAVSTAFCKRAAIAQQLTSCLTEHFFARAIERAKYLDEYMQKEGKPIGPLHGIPITSRIASA